MTTAEGFWEATMELLLSFFIVLSRTDRKPSTVQLASMAASLIMTIKTGIADFLRDQPPMERHTEVQAYITLFPLSLLQYPLQTGFLGGDSISAQILDGHCWLWYDLSGVYGWSSPSLLLWKKEQEMHHHKIVASFDEFEQSGRNI